MLILAFYHSILLWCPYTACLMNNTFGQEKLRIFFAEPQFEGIVRSYCLYFGTKLGKGHFYKCPNQMHGIAFCSQKMCPCCSTVVIYYSDEVLVTIIGLNSIWPRKINIYEFKYVSRINLTMRNGSLCCLTLEQIKHYFIESTQS